MLPNAGEMQIKLAEAITKITMKARMGKDFMSGLLMGGDEFACEI
jgi:hypothetical protein